MAQTYRDGTRVTEMRPPSHGMTVPNSDLAADLARTLRQLRELPDGHPDLCGLTGADKEKHIQSIRMLITMLYATCGRDGSPGVKY